MKIKIYDKSCVRVVTGAAMLGEKVSKTPMTTYLNMRVLRNSGLFYTKTPLQAVDDETKPSQRGYIKKYYCPVCGRPMWCTLEDARQPYITCRKCASTEVDYLYDSKYSDVIMPAWTEMMSQCYDPLCPGEGTTPGGVCEDWLDPVAFSMWMNKLLPALMERVMYEGCSVWLITKDQKNWNAITADLSAKPPKEYKKIKII